MTQISLPPKAKILVIRRDNIGDLVCTTPAFAALRRHYPNAEIAALVNSYNAEVLHGNPNIDRIFVYQKLKHAGSIRSRLKALTQRLTLIAQLRRWNPDVTILAKAGYERHALNFARQMGAKNIIGYVPDNLSKAKGLPDIRLVTPTFTALHEVEAINGLLKPLGIEDALGPLQVFAAEPAVSKLKQQLLAAKKCIALHISAREPERRWGINYFMALIQRMLATQPDTLILLFWSPGKSNDPHHPGDDEAAAALIKAAQSERLIPIPTQNLTELIAALSVCDIFIGTDGGALHLAVGLNKPCVALFENSPAKLNHWYPWRVPNRVVHGERQEVASIPLPALVEALASLQAEVASKA